MTAPRSRKEDAMTWALTKEQLDAVAEVFLDHDERIAREEAEAQAAGASVPVDGEQGE